MKEHLKGSLKVLTAYGAITLIFIVFLPIILNLMSDGSEYWLTVYSGVTFFLMLLMVYGDMKRLAEKERRPQYDLSHYVLKGLVLGLIGFLPVIILELLYPVIVFDDELKNRAKQLVLHTLMGPLFVIIKLGGKTFAAYALASAVVPVTSMLGYMAGLFGFELGVFNKFYARRAKTVQQKKNH